MDTATDAPAWTLDDAASTYRINGWGDGYFFINDAGHVAVRPRHDADTEVDLHDVVQRLRDEGVRLPVLLRFQDLLHARVSQLNEAFRTAIAEFGYSNEYHGVYPIKVNQLHEVVEEILEAGLPYGLGLECGSKAELVAALPHLTDDETLLICNGYKDAAMLRLMLVGQTLGKNVVPVLEKYNELETLLALADEMEANTPVANGNFQFGVRIRLSTAGSGKWADSGGDRSKFGISLPELIRLVDRLAAEDRTDALRLLHFHQGSQIADILSLKQAAKEITRVYAQLYKRGIQVKYLDVGGGLGVNYESGDYQEPKGLNYTMHEYVNAIVYAVKEVCDAEGVPHPMLVSESGRAMTAHHSVLIVEAMGAYTKDFIDDGYALPAEPATVLRELHDLLPTDDEALSVSGLLERYHDAREKREQADLLFLLGYLPIEQKADAERLYWTILRAVSQSLDALDLDHLPADLEQLPALLSDQYLCDFSVFQSMLDYWAIDQRFPIMPIARLDEAPERRGTIVDLTCDSDGRIDRFPSADGDKPYLELHQVLADEPYMLGIFLMGAYQDIMGDNHNLFGRVNEAHIFADDEEPGNFYVEKIIAGTKVGEMLPQVQYFPYDLERRMNTLIQQKVKAKKVRPNAGVQLLDYYKRAFDEYTYLTQHD